jgi:hypothetical protein
MKQSRTDNKVPKCDRAICCKQSKDRVNDSAGRRLEMDKMSWLMLCMSQYIDYNSMCKALFYVINDQNDSRTDLLSWIYLFYVISDPNSSSVIYFIQSNRRPDMTDRFRPNSLTIASCPSTREETSSLALGH